MKIDQTVQVSGRLSALCRCLDRSAAVMAQDHYQRHAQMLHAVLDAAQRDVIDYLSGSSHYEDVSQTLIEDNFRRNLGVGVGASRHDGKRMRAGDELRAAIDRGN